MSHPRSEASAARQRGPVAEVSGNVNWQSYLLMKQKPDSLFIHANSHITHYTDIGLKSRGGDRLNVRVRPESAVASSSWNAENRRLTLSLNDYEGADRITVTEQ